MWNLIIKCKQPCFHFKQPFKSLVQSIAIITLEWPTLDSQEELTPPGPVWRVEGGEGWVRGQGTALLSLHLSRRVCRGTSQCCVRLANTQGAPEWSAKSLLLRIMAQLLPCWEQEVHCHRVLWPSLSSGSMYHCRTACQSSHAGQGEQAEAGPAVNVSLAPCTGKKANGMASVGSVSCSNTFLVHGNLRSRLKEVKQIPSMKPFELMMCKRLIV